MAKQDGKQTLADKKAVGKKPTAQVQKPVQEQKSVMKKEPGPAPDFSENKARAEARRQNELAAIEKARQAESDAKEHKLRLSLEAKQEQLQASYTAFAAGELGHDYLIGTEQFRFVVYQRPFSAKCDLPAQMVTVIEEYRALHGTNHPVYIPHNWLFRNIKKVPFVGGHVGDIQKMMFDFLKASLSKEIATEKAFRLNPPLLPKNPAIATMATVDQEHSVALADTGRPTGDGIASMYRVDREHEQLVTA